MKTDYMVPYGDGEMWHFFMHEEQGLCLRKKKDNKWREHEILLDSAVFGFVLISDNNGGVHIACQDKSGGVLYLTFDQHVWHKYVILKSKSAMAYPKHFALVPQEKELVLCYSLRYNNYLMIAAQVIGRDTEPVVVDVVSNGERPFCCMKEGENVRIIYTNVSGILGSKLYSIRAGAVGSHEPIMPAGGQAFAYRDSFGRIHIAAQAVEGEGIAYCRRDLDGTYNGHQTVGVGGFKAQNPIIMAENEKMWIMWEAEGHIYYVLSVDDAQHFSEPVRFLFNGDSRQFHMITPKEESVCFGYVTSSGEVHLFIQSGQNRIKGAQTGKINTQLQKTPMADSAQAPPKQTSTLQQAPVPQKVPVPQKASEPKMPEPAHDIEAQKTQIMITMLNTQVAGLKKQINALTKRVSELETAQAYDRYHHSENEEKKGVVEDAQPKKDTEAGEIATAETTKPDQADRSFWAPAQSEENQPDQKVDTVGAVDEIKGEEAPLPEAETNAAFIENGKGNEADEVAQ